MLVFVYGTLRRGESNHHFMDGAEFVAEATTEPEFTMVTFGGYPAILEGGATAIAGEVYRITLPILARLDLLEEVPELYRRVTRELLGHSTMLYVLPEAHARDVPILAHGDWCRRHEG